MANHLPGDQVLEASLAVKDFCSDTDTYRPGFGESYKQFYDFLGEISRDEGLQHYLLLGIDHTVRGLFPFHWVVNQVGIYERLAYVIGNQMAVDGLDSKKLIPVLEGLIFDPEPDKSDESRIDLIE